MEPLKPAKTYKEQIDHLRNAHGLIIDNEKLAESVLSRVSYYRLSAYGLSFRDPNNSDLYLPGTTFRDIYRLYSFDRLFRSLLFAALAEVEIQFRTRVAHHLAIEYGPEGYMDASHFKQIKDNASGNTTHSVTIGKFQDEVRRQSALPCVRHHKAKYGGHFPIWAAVELFSFGMTSTLYKCMLPKDQEAVAKTYHTDAKHLSSWVLCFVEVRNICAHSGRLYNTALKQTPMLYSDQAQYANPNKLFPVLLVLKKILDGQAIWETLAIGMSAAVDQYSDADLSCMGFPAEWKTLLCVPDWNAIKPK